jgi:hypothetical protein
MEPVTSASTVAIAWAVAEGGDLGYSKYALDLVMCAWGTKSAAAHRPNCMGILKDIVI